MAGIPRAMSFALLLLAAVTPSFSDAHLDGPVAQAVAAMSARIDAIAAADPASKEELKESKSLSKARAAFTAYSGDNTVADLAALGKGAKSIAKSGTADPAVRDGLTAVLEGLVAVAQDREAWAQDTRDLLQTEKFRASVDAALAAAAARLGQGADLLEQDPAKAAALLVQAVLGYGKGLARAEKCLGKEWAQRPVPRDCGSTGGPGTMTALIDGVPWAADQVSASVDYDWSGKVNSLRVTGWNSSQKNFISISFAAQQDASRMIPLAPGEFSLDRSPADNWGWMGDLQWQEPPHNIDTLLIRGGTVTVVSVDALAQTMSGTFQFVGDDYNNQGHPVSVTNGTFQLDCVFLQYP